MAFRPIAGQMHMSLANTPLTPFQLVSDGGNNINEQIMVIRVFLFGASAGTDIALAYAPSATDCAAIAGTGTDTGLNKQTRGVIHFGCGTATTTPTFLDYIAIPSNSWITMWTAVTSATADAYLCPGLETTH